MTRQRAFWLGLAGSAGFLAVFLVFFVDTRTIGEVLRDANYSYVAPSLLFYFIALYLRAHRWRFLLRPIFGESRRPIFPVVVVGYMANNLIPVRIGEVVRSYYLSLREDITTAGAFGTVAVERASDVLALLFFIALAWTLVPVSGAFGEVAGNVPGGAATLAAAALLPFLLVAGVVVVVSVMSKSTALALAARIMSPVPAGVRDAALGLVEHLLQGLTVASSPRALLYLFLLSVPIWLFEAAMYGTIALGFDLHSMFDGNLEFIAVVLVFTAAANLAGIFPSSAGSWGPFDFFGALALVALGVSEGLASGYALTVHVALWVPPTLLGAILLLMDGNSLARLYGGAAKARASNPAPDTPTEMSP